MKRKTEGPQTEDEELSEFIGLTLRNSCSRIHENREKADEADKAEIIFKKIGVNNGILKKMTLDTLC